MQVNKFYQFNVTATNEVGSGDPTDPPLPVQNIGPLTPSLGTPVPTPDGYRVQILNYNGQYQWSGTATQNGQVTVDDNDGYATITGVAPNTNSVATITASRFAYTDQSSTTNGTSLLAKLDPNLINVTRTATGYTADIQNYDPLYNWEASVLPGTGSALIAHVGNIYQLQVTVPGANTPATATVATTRTGYAPGSATLTGVVADDSPHPEFGEESPDGYRVHCEDHELRSVLHLERRSAWRCARRLQGNNRGRPRGHGHRSPT